MSRQTEKVSLEAISGLMEEKKMTGNSWYGVPKPETHSISLVVFNDDMTRPVDEGRVVDTIYPVFNKAFGMIFHSITIEAGTILSTGQNDQMGEILAGLSGSVGSSQ